MESAVVGFQALRLLELVHGRAGAVVEVVVLSSLAQLDRVRVGDVLAGGRGAPRVVLAAAELHVMFSPANEAPRALMPGPWISWSMSSCGAK